MRTVAFAAIAAFAAADISDFPHDSWNHAGCHVTASFDADCDSVYNQIVTEVSSWDPEPLSTPGYYSLYEDSTDSYVWSKRLTYNKKYTDDQLFQFSANGTGCTVTGKSRSESVSMLDNGVNYCNLWNVYQGVKTAGVANTVTIDKVSSCSVTPKDPVSNCARY